MIRRNRHETDMVVLEKVRILEWNIENACILDFLCI